MEAGFCLRFSAQISSEWLVIIHFFTFFSFRAKLLKEFNSIEHFKFLLCLCVLDFLSRQFRLFMLDMHISMVSLFICSAWYLSISIRHLIADIYDMLIRFDIEGYVTGFGHPDWLRTHEPSTRTSPVVLALVEGGATCIGKTVVDELAYRYLPLQTVFLRSRLWVFNNVLELKGNGWRGRERRGQLEGMITC